MDNLENDPEAKITRSGMKYSAFKNPTSTIIAIDHEASARVAQTRPSAIAD